MSFRVFLRILFIGLIIWISKPYILRAQNKIEKGIINWNELKIYDPIRSTSKKVLFFDLPRQ